jgi:hypothetical protein
MKNLTKIEIEKMKNHSITIYWWNFRKKQLDFEGTYFDYLKRQDFKITAITKQATIPSEAKIKGYSVYMPVGCSEITFDSYSSDIFHVLNSAIKLFLSHMGDKATLQGNYNFYNINF